MSLKNKIKGVIDNYNAEALFADGLDAAIVGVGKQWDGEYILVYDSDKCIEILEKKFLKENTELSQEDAYVQAVEWFSYNVECAYVGKNTPIFMSSIESILEK